MKYNELSPLERFFTEEKENAIKDELLGSSERPVFDRFMTLCRACLERDMLWDGFSERYVEFLCWLIDQDKQTELFDLLEISSFWGIYPPDENELCPLCYAICRHKTDTAKGMIRIQARDNRLHVLESYQPGFVAVAEQQYDIIRCLLENGVGEDLFAGQYTGLQLAAVSFDLEAAKIFIDEFRHDINKTYISKTPPLNTAVENDDIPMVEYLLSHPEIDVNKPGENGMNPIELAKSDAVRNMLLSKGAVPSSENVKLVCAAIRAAAVSYSTKLESLVKELVSLEGASAVTGEFDLLRYTVMYDHFNATRMIIENGLVDLGNYQQNLFSLCRCNYRRDGHERTISEQLRYLRLFKEYGYRFPFSSESYEHQMAAHLLKKDANAKQLQAASAIMEDAGVILDD